MFTAVCRFESNLDHLVRRKLGSTSNLGTSAKFLLCNLEFPTFFAYHNSKNILVAALV